jgi:predicted nucleic acid-binding protein
MGVALLDTSIVIAALNRDDALHAAASRAVLDHRQRHALAISVVTYAEMLVGPLLAGAGAMRTVERFAAETRILDLRPEVARAAAELRARRKLGLADAIVVATGLHNGVDVILTGDERWRGLSKVQVVVRGNGQGQGPALA